MVQTSKDGIFIGIVTRQSIIQYLMNNADKYMQQ